MDWKQKRIRDLKAMAVNRCISGCCEHNYDTNCIEVERNFKDVNGRMYLTASESRELERLEGRYPGYY